jgi:tetrahydrodipicolinate N-succinyltransferase
VFQDNCGINYAVVGHQSRLGTGVSLSKGCVLSQGVVLPDDTLLDASILVSGPVKYNQSTDHDDGKLRCQCL